MKKITGSILALTLFAFTANAQIDRDQRSNNDQQGYRKDRGRMGGLDNLNLSDAQKEQVKVINADFKAKMTALKNNNTSGTDMRTQMQPLMQERRNKISAILTPAQRTQFEQQAKTYGQKGMGRNDNANTQGNGNNGRDLDHDRERGEGDQIGRMQKELGLSADQVSRIQSNNQLFKSRMIAIKENTSLTQEQKMQQMKSLHAEKEASMRNILTAEQMVKFNHMKDNKDGSYKEKHKGKNGKNKNKVKTT